MQYNEKKAAQIAAFFILRSNKSIHVLKLIKLMYLSERESFAQYGEPLTGDKPFSLDNGPILSKTLNLMNGIIPSEDWESWISDRANHMLTLNKDLKSEDELKLLSEADLEILEKIWTEFGPMDRFELCKLTHNICGEWQDPKGSSIPITYQRLLTSVGYNAKQAKELIQRMNEKSVIDSTFKSLN